MSSAKNQIRAALSQAQAYAARAQKNAGIRFEKSAKGRQYMVLIEHQTNYVYDDGTGGYFSGKKFSALRPDR